jgi:hypothetical protein
MKGQEKIVNKRSLWFVKILKHRINLKKKKSIIMILKLLLWFWTDIFFRIF